MLTILKKAKRAIDVAMSPAKPKITAKEVHEDFYNEAKSLLAPIEEEVKRKSDRAKMLNETGLRSVSDYIECSDAAEKLSSRGNAEYYAGKYPNYKFISRNQIARLCKKYGLFFGEVSKYIGDIPQKNLNDLKIELDMLDFESIYTNHIGHQSTSHFEMRYGKDFLQNVIAAKGEQIKVGHIKSEHSEYDVLAHVSKYHKFSIAAQPSMFKIEKYDKVEDGVFIVDKDPIIFCEVNYGYLIITAWGDETNIPEIVNEKMN